jgi:predicted neutral ceramidase superfamily lipid hydrolase
MADSLHAQIVKIVQAALVEQDALTYHGTSGDTHTRAEAAAREIETIFDANAAERKRQEMFNPPRGIQINANGGGVQTYDSRFGRG